MNFSEDSEKSRNDINLWVENQTNGKIKDLLAVGTINCSTKLILVNAIYFKCMNSLLDFIIELTDY